MTKTKPHKAISCIQHSHNGPFNYAYKLPYRTQMSNALKNLLTPILQSLIESNQNQMWSYSKFFHASINLTNNCVFISVLDTTSFDTEKIVLRPNDKLENFLLPTYSNKLLETDI